MANNRRPYDVIGPSGKSEFERRKEEIDDLSHYEMAYLFRFAPAGHPYFKKGEVGDYFDKRFKSFGGMTTSLSKILSEG